MRPNADSIAARNLARQGFTTFQPLEAFTTIRGGRFVARQRPFFPGYMFVGYASAAAPWSVVNSTYGVSRLVKFGDAPVTVPGSLIADLQAACDDKGFIATEVGVMAGSKVEIASGTFTGFVGQVERLTPDHRALVLIEFLGKRTRANLPVAQLKIASEHAYLKGRNRE